MIGGQESLTSIAEAPLRTVEGAALQYLGSIGLRNTPDFQLRIVEADWAGEAHRALDTPEGVTARYFPEHRQAVVFESTLPGMPLTARSEAASGAVHESTHNAVPMPGLRFFDEAIAGMAEIGFLMRHRRAGTFSTARDYRIEAGAKNDSFALTVPGACRYVDAREDKGPSAGDGFYAYTGSGFVSALGLAYGLEASGITARQIIAHANVRPQNGQDLMKQALDAIRPGIWRQYARKPSGILGLAQATAVIQHEAARQGIVPDIGRLYAL